MRKISNTKMRFGEVFAYGLGGVGSNITGAMIGIFLTIYLTDTAGIAAGFVGTMFLLTRMFDGISDIYMGRLVDRTNTGRGKAKPWVLWTAIPLGAFTFLAFFVPDIGMTGKMIYTAAVYFIVTVIITTASNVSYGSLLTFATVDPVTRVKLGSWRNILGLIGSLAVSSSTIFLVDMFGGGQGGWTVTAAGFSILCAGTLLITGIFVKERNQVITQDTAKGPSFFKVVKLLVKEKYFMLILLFHIVYYFKNMRFTVLPYYAKYMLHNENTIGLFTVAMALPMLLVVPFAASLVKKHGMRRTMLAGMLVSIVGEIIIVFYPTNLIGLLAGNVIQSLGCGPLIAGIFALIADVSDYIYWKSGIPIQATAFSCSSAGNKLGTGLGAAIVGWFLALSHYIPNVEIQSEGVMFAMKSLNAYIPLALAIAIFLILWGIDVEKYMPKVREQISNGQIGENALPL